MQISQPVPDGTEMFEPNSGVTITLSVLDRENKERGKSSGSKDAQGKKN